MADGKVDNKKYIYLLFGRLDGHPDVAMADGRGEISL
jgi:hypothetical protein